MPHSPSPEPWVGYKDLFQGQAGQRCSLIALSLSWADRPNKAWLCSASCSLALGYLCVSSSARPVFSVWRLYFSVNPELRLLILWSVHVELWLHNSNVVYNVRVTFGSYMKSPTIYSPFNNESISGSKSLIQASHSWSSHFPKAFPLSLVLKYKSLHI